MAMNNNKSSKESITIPNELINIIWGNNCSIQIFNRWSQPFKFSPDEPTALIQHEGGPCSVLTTVQAHLLNELLFCPRYQHNWRDASSDEVDLHFLNALVSILQLLSSKDRPIYLANFTIGNPIEHLEMRQFHERILFSTCQTNADLKQQVFSRLHMWKNAYGVLLFLYSCLMTKTVDQLKHEIDDETSFPLIDVNHGHGSQCLTNLLITGVATQNCFDGDKDVEGLRLCGIREQASIGFLTGLEFYRFLEVGWFLKNPKNPIWIIGSETHLTVIFSREKDLVQQENETPVQKATKIFRKYDTEKNGFITSTLLGQVINELVQSSVIEVNSTIDILQHRMDPDGLQIITQTAFLQELFPEDNLRNLTRESLNILNGKPFIIYHYNGLPRSNKDNKVRYASAEAAICDYGYGNDTPSSAVASVQSGTHFPITDVLRTKWPTIEIKWDDGAKPSLN